MARGQICTEMCTLALASAFGDEICINRESAAFQAPPHVNVVAIPQERPDSLTWMGKDDRWAVAVNTDGQ